uniref:Uncharacterized protein n=1 Tax=Panagrolaimus superbus TaxID=310955 RepID=A0A914Y7W3_9BILA
MNGDRNINVSCKFSFPLVNKLLTENEKLQMTSTSNVYVTRFGTFNELMDPANNFIVDDYLIIKMEAILIIAKNKTDTVSNIQQSNCCKLGSKLWERDDKDFVIIVDGKEIKVSFY